MSLAKKIREVLRNRPMTVEQLSSWLCVTSSVVDRTTGFQMFDVYEEDDGRIKLLGIDYERFEKQYQRLTDEAKVIIRQNEGKTFGEMAQAICDQLGISYSRQTISAFARANGVRHFNRYRRKWTPEIDECVRQGFSVCEINKKFGTHFTQSALKIHRHDLGLTKQSEWTPEIERYLIAHWEDQGVVDDINRIFGTHFTKTAVRGRFYMLGLRRRK